MTPAQRKQILQLLSKKLSELSWPVYQLETNPGSTQDIASKIVTKRNEIVELLDVLVEHLPKKETPE